MTEVKLDKDMKLIKQMQEAHASLRKQFPDLYHDLTIETYPEYAGIAIAMIRSELAKKEGAICTDSVAGVICGEEGAAMAKLSANIPVYCAFDPRTTIALRTYFADYAMKARHPSIHQIVIFGAGLDTRAFRLKELEGCHVIEVDGNKRIQDFKKRRIEELKLSMFAKQRDVLVMNISDSSWPDHLLALGFKPNEPTFWLMEGFLMYLTPKQGEALLKAVDKLSAPHSEMFCDMTNGDLFCKIKTPDGERMRKYGEDDEVLKTLPWTHDVVFRRSASLEYSGSLWDATKYKDYMATRKEDAMFGPVFDTWLKKDVEENP